MEECTQPEARMEIQNFWTQTSQIYKDDSDDEEEGDEENNASHGDTSSVQAHVEVPVGASSSKKRPNTMTQHFPRDNSSSTSFQTPSSKHIDRKLKFGPSTRTKKKKLEKSDPTLTQIFK